MMTKFAPDLMPLAEKVSLCSGSTFWLTDAVPVHDLRAIFVADGPHGVRRQKDADDPLGVFESIPATCFPTAVGLASSWDVDLLEEVGEALARECHAQQVAVLLGPGANIKRHPLCGRNFEYFSEDPHLTGKLAAALIKGVQRLGVGTSLKHYAVNNQECHRLVTNAIVDERTLREIYLAGFEIAVKEAQPWTVMAAYNLVNDQYCCEHPMLLQQILREEWGFEGLVMSDWGAVHDRVAGLAAGLDLEMPGNGKQHDPELLEAVQSGDLSEDILDASVQRMLSLLQKGNELPEDAPPFDEDAHHLLARRAATSSIVLLKHERELLPLQQDARLLVIGEMAKEPRIQGNGSSRVSPTRLETPWEALQERWDAERLAFASGYHTLPKQSDASLVDEAVEKAKNADVVVLFAGLPSAFESEGIDRAHLQMPMQQIALIEAVAEANSNLVVVLQNGAPIVMPWLEAVPALLESYLGGQAAGHAIVDVLLGDANPSGKLAETFPCAQEDCASDPYFPGHPRQVEYREGLFVGYRYFDTAARDVLFPFGHGLSYTSFAYETPRLIDDATTLDMDRDDAEVTVSVEVVNTGDREGAEVVQLYVHRPDSPVVRPQQELRAFAKVSLQPGERKEVSFRLTRRAFALYDVGTSAWQVEPGLAELRFASSSRDIRQTLTLSLASSFVAKSEAVDDVYRAFGEGGEGLSDESFSALLGRPLPVPRIPDPLTRNSTLDDARDTWLGRMLFRMTHWGAQRMLRSSGQAEFLEALETGLAETPLRSLVQLGGGRFRFRHLDAMIHMMNGQWWRGIRVLFGAKSG